MPPARHATTATATTDPAIRSLLDREELRTLVHEVGRCLDEHRFDDLRRIYHVDAVAQTPGGRAVGIEALVAQARASHTRTAGVQHLISDVAVDVDADRADVRANLIATFVDDVLPPTPRFQLGEVYRFTAVREQDGWMLTSVTSTPIWTIGERP